jgi:hypothetical protein
MIKLVKFILYLLYNYYKDGASTRTMPYLYAVMVIISIVFMNILTFMSFFGQDLIQVFALSVVPDSKWIQYIYAFLFVLLPGYFLISIFIKKNDVIHQEYDYKTVSKGNVGLIIYIVITFVLFFLSATLNR